MDRFPPARDGPRYELQAIQRSLDDLEPLSWPRLGPEDIWKALFVAAAGVLTIVAFVAWLFATSPVHA